MINQLSQKRPALKQPIWFIIIGTSSSCVHFCTVFISVHFFAIKPLLANIYAFCIAFLVSFFGHRRFTFCATHIRWQKTLPKYLSVAVLSFALNETFYWYLLHHLNIDYRLALAIVLGCVSILTFTLSKCWAFTQKRPSI
jgi:putative flippase GtrA